MIEVGKVIYNILSNDSDVKSLVGTKIFPLVAESNTTFPFITYKRNSLTPTNSKDRFICNAESYVEVNVCDTNYNKSIDLAEKVISALEGKKGTYNNIDVQNIEFDNSSEEFNEDTYIQNITFKIKIK